MNSNIIDNYNEYFKAVTQSVENWHKVETEIENEKNLITQFDDYLSKNADEIGAFRTVENEIVEFLKQYSFEKGINLSPAQNILQPLPELKQKLVELTTEAKKIANKPDRYNCHKAIEVCKKLMLFCTNEMKSADYNNVTKLLEQNIEKLREIQNKFAHEDADVFNLSEKIQRLSNQIKNYADRFNKKIVLNKAQQLLQAVEQTKFNSFAQIKQDLEQCVKSIETVIANFDKERNETVALRNKLTQNAPNSWSEDNEQLISEIDDVISQDTAAANFSLQAFYDKNKKLPNRKKTDIESFKKTHSNLLNRYGKRLNNNIEKSYVSYSFFKRWIIDMLEEERLRKKAIWEKIFRIIGKIFKAIFSVAGFIIMGIIAVIGFLISIFTSSRDD